MDELDHLVEQRTVELSTAVEALKAAKEEAKAVALQDPLTKLPNWRLFHNRLTLTLQKAERHPGCLCALLYLDIDDFRVINDSLGHQAGDELLVEVAQRLQTTLRRTDAISRFPGGEDLVARMGGDEFAILLDEIKDPSDSLRVADRLRAKLQAPIHLRGKDLSVTVSIGMTTNTSENPTAEACCAMRIPPCIGPRLPGGVDA
jgi:diguanylate cyclase (GGDEF)-like protein